VILATRQWAFVWCHRASNWYYLHGYIIFAAPHTASWLHANLGNGTYELPHEDPNPFRNREIDLAETFEEIGEEVIILVDDGHFEQW
jgi:hypothetical protein